jgi:hypothetical protein
MAERDGEEIKQDMPGELPVVESPPLSPASASSEASVDAEASTDSEASVDAEASADTKDEAAVSAAAAPRAWFQFSRRHQRHATLAVWLALVAGLGALFGGAISNGLADHGRVAVADLAQRKAMQQSIDHLANQVSELQVKLAAATAATQSQIAKISARADRQSGANITGSVPTPRLAPVPIPRPAPRIAAAVSRPAVVRGWRILRARGDWIDVKGRGGIYEVVPGAVLPGLGRVQSVEQWDGRWVVVTPKGLIVSARDRGYFKDF